jgi:drug/metabolite transporter (DMT)-like permease
LIAVGAIVALGTMLGLVNRGRARESERRLGFTPGFRAAIITVTMAIVLAGFVFDLEPLLRWLPVGLVPALLMLFFIRASQSGTLPPLTTSRIVGLAGIALLLMGWAVYLAVADPSPVTTLIILVPLVTVGLALAAWEKRRHNRP